MKKIINLKSIENKESNANDNTLKEIKIDDKNQLNQNLSINDKIKSNTSDNFLNEKKNSTIFKEFPGFFFKKFNLTAYKKERSESRERSKSSEHKYKPTHKKGNGVPNDLVKRLNYLSKIINAEEFIKYYHNRPRGMKVKFEDIYNYIMHYKKTHSDLESVLMLFYFICNDIKYYSEKALEKAREKYKNKIEYMIFSDSEFFKEGYNPKPQEVFMKGIALNPNHFSNVLEFFLKKMEIKFKHIEGYCKLMEINEENKQSLQKKLKNKKSSLKSQRSKSTASLKDIQSLPENTVNHIWNAVYLKGEWYFVDAFLGSGGFIKDVPTPPNVKNQNKNKNPFNIYYFMTPPEFLISTHRPLEDRWQFLDKTLIFEQFYNRKLINYGEFYRCVVNNNIELISHKYPCIEINKNEKLEIKIRLVDHILEGELYTTNLLNKIGEIRTIFDEDSKIYYFEPIFPSVGDYVFRINARPIITGDLAYEPLLDYKIRVKNIKSYLYFEKYKLNKKEENKMKEKNNDMINTFFPKLNNSSNIRLQHKIINDYSKILPSRTNKLICYDDKNFHLMEPRTKILRKGIKFKFKIRIKGANNVHLLDGNHWIPLKRTEEDVYEGIKEIETDNVSICCIRNKNVFTEVIKFMIHKDRSILSKSFLPQIKKNKRSSTKLNLGKMQNINLTRIK